MNICVPPAPTTLLFEETEDGDLIDVEFDYVRSWETSPAQTKLVRICGKS